MKNSVLSNLVSEECCSHCGCTYDASYILTRCPSCLRLVVACNACNNRRCRDCKYGSNFDETVYYRIKWKGVVPDLGNNKFLQSGHKIVEYFGVYIEKELIEKFCNLAYKSGAYLPDDKDEVTLEWIQRTWSVSFEVDDG